MLVNTFQKIHTDINHPSQDFSTKNAQTDTSETLLNFVKSAMASFLQRMKIFKQNIEDSKIAIRYLMNQIRQQGHVRITPDTQNTDKNANNDEESSQIFYTMSPQNNALETFYPSTRIDENFDMDYRKEALSKDDQFQDRMNQNVKESVYHDFSTNDIWKASNELNSFKHLESVINHFQFIYNQKKISNSLDKNFFANINASQFVINGNILRSDNHENMIKDLKKLIPDSNYQKLISTYADQNILDDVFSHLAIACPALKQYNFINSKNIYKINRLDNGLIKIVITNISDLDLNNKQLTAEYHSCGMRATVIVSPTNTPIIKYSYFVE